MTDARNPDGDWPAWLEPLRPDDVARARMRSAVERAAAPRLRHRRRTAVWRSTGGLARLVAPAAAIAVVAFGWLAHEADRPAERGPLEMAAGGSVEVEEMMRARNGAPPTLLTSASAPSTDLVLQATLEPGGGR